MSVRTSIGRAGFDPAIEGTDRRAAAMPAPTFAQSSQGVTAKSEDSLTEAITSLSRLLARQAAAEFVVNQEEDLPQ